VNPPFSTGRPRALGPGAWALWGVHRARRAPRGGG